MSSKIITLSVRFVFMMADITFVSTNLLPHTISSVQTYVSLGQSNEESIYKRH